MRHVTAQDIERTAATLDAMAHRQEALGAALERTGLRNFADRADWLIAHRTPDEQLAAARQWKRRGLKPDRKPRRVRPAPPQPKLTGQELIDELDWLLSNGSSAWEALDALKRDPETTARLAYRYGRPDLAQAVDAVRQAS